MAIFRFMGLWIFLLAVVALTVDITKSVAHEEITLTAFGAQWHELHPNSLKLLQTSVEKFIHPYARNPILVSILSLPTWVFLSFFGLFFFWLGRKRTKPSAFVN